MDRFEAAIDLVKQDRVSTPGKETTGAYARDALVTGHDIYTNALPVLLSPLSDNDYTVVPRRTAVDGTVEGVKTALQARWFEKGNLLNVVPKTIAALNEPLDGVGHDILHIGGGNKNGSVLKTAA